MKNNKTNLNPIDHRVFKYWEALYMAFYSSRLYVDVGKRWRGFGLLYFFLVIAIAVVPFSIKSMFMLNDYFDDQIIFPLKKIPQFEIKQGKLSFDYFMPYLIKSRNGDVVVVVDDKVSLTEVNYAYPHWMLFITSDCFYSKTPSPSFFNGSAFESDNLHSKEVTMQPFADIQSGSLSGGKWLEQAGIEQTKWYFLFSIYPSLLGFLYGIFTVLLLFVAILAKAVAHIFLNYKISFAHSYRLLLVSSGSGVSLFIMSLSFGQLPLMGLCLLMSIALYFCYAILCLKRESKQVVLA